MDYKTEQWNRLIDLLEEANSLQQLLISDIESSYHFHTELETLIEQLTDAANTQGIYIC